MMDTFIKAWNAILVIIQLLCNKALHHSNNILSCSLVLIRINLSVLHAFLCQNCINLLIKYVNLHHMPSKKIITDQKYCIPLMSYSDLFNSVHSARTRKWNEEGHQGKIFYLPYCVVTMVKIYITSFRVVTVGKQVYLTQFLRGLVLNLNSFPLSCIIATVIVVDVLSKQCLTLILKSLSSCCIANI